MDRDEQGGSSVACAHYRAMMRRYLAGSTTAAGFADEYVRDYLADETAWDEETFDILDGVFAVANDMYEDPRDREGLTLAYSPDDLKRRVEAALAALDAVRT